jgi:hypothetical protein
MKININARLNVPSRQMCCSGTNPPILTRTGEIEVSVNTPKDLDILLRGFLLVGDILCKIESYDPVSNTAFLQGHVQSTDIGYITTLVLEGWIENGRAFQKYGI